MNAELTFDFGRGKTTLCFDFERMELADGKGIEFFNIEDPADRPENKGKLPTIQQVVDDNWLRKKFFYQTDLFGEKFAYVACKDICTLKVK